MSGIFDVVYHDFKSYINKNGRDIIREVTEVAVKTVIVEIANQMSDKKEEEQKTERDIILENMIPDQPIHIDELHVKTRIHVGKLSGLLMMLEMENKIKQMPGHVFVKI